MRHRAPPSQIFATPLRELAAGSASTRQRRAAFCCSTISNPEASSLLRQRVRGDSFARDRVKTRSGEDKSSVRRQRAVSVGRRLAALVGVQVATAAMLLPGRSFDVDVAQGGRLLADEHLLTQAVWTLLTYAAAIAETGRKIPVRLQPGGARLRLEVLFDAPSVPAEEMERAFAPFASVQYERGSAIRNAVGLCTAAVDPPRPRPRSGLHVGCRSLSIWTLSRAWCVKLRGSSMSRLQARLLRVPGT